MTDEESDDQMLAAIAVLQPQIESGDAEAMYRSAVLHHAYAMTNYSRSHFEIAEKLLIKAAEGGHKEANSFYSGWEAFKYVFRRRLERRKGN